MSMIEEAWAAVGKDKHDYGCPRSSTLRALALAAYDAGRRPFDHCESSSCGSVQPDKGIWRCRYCTGRLDVEALGA